MKKISQLFFIALIISLVLPSIALASWWNPFSWFNNWGNGNKTEVLEKRIQELEAKIGTSTESNTKIQQPKTDISKIEGVNNAQTDIKINRVSSKDMVEMIDTFITKTQSDLARINEFLKNVNYYSGNASKSNEGMSELISSETDPYLMSMWEFIQKNNNILIELSDNLKNNYIEGARGGSIPYLLKIVTDRVASLEKTKKEIPEYYLNEEGYNNELKKLADEHFAYSKNILDKTHNSHIDYLNVVEAWMDSISKTKPDVESYMSEKRRANNTITTTIYQPLMIPEIKMPKTTYCTSRWTGVNGSYDITCN